MPGSRTQAGLIAYEALDLLAVRMRPFVEERLREEFGEGWRGRLQVDGLGRVLGDPWWQLRQIADNWIAFADALAVDGSESDRGIIRGLAFDLIQSRNKVDHHDLDEGPSLALRVIDLTSRLLNGFGLSDDQTGEEFERLRSDAARLLAGGSTGAEVLARRRAEYIDSVLGETAHLDLRGISTGDLTTVVGIDFADVFVEPTLHRIEDSADLRHVPSAEETTPNYAWGAWRARYLPAGRRELSEQGAEPVAVNEVARAPRAVVLGAPGAGKTTLLRSIARSALLGDRGATESRIPVILRAARFAENRRLDPHLTLRRFIVSRLSDRYGDVIKEALESERALVLVDGLDEVPDEGDRRRVADAVDSFARDHAAIQVIATSRTIGYRVGALGPSFTMFGIAPFNDAQTAEFVGRWLAAVGRVRSDVPDPDEVVSEINATGGLRDLASSPLLLTMILLARLSGGRIPARRVDLFRLATETLLHEWPLHRLKLTIDERDMRALLEPIAHDMIAEGLSWISETVLVEGIARRLLERNDVAFDEARRQAREMLDLIERATGFFAAVGRDQGERVYAFVHRTFVEYLAARHLAELWMARNLDLAGYVHAPLWREVVQLFFAHLSTVGEAAATRAVEDLLALERPLESHLGANRRLAAYLVGDIARVKVDLRQRIIRALIDDFLDPRMDPFRDETRGLLAHLMRTVGIGSASALIFDAPGDSPATLARKSLLRWELDPSDPSALARVLSQAEELAATYADPSALASEIARVIPGIHSVAGHMNETGCAGLITTGALRPDLPFHLAGKDEWESDDGSNSTDRAEDHAGDGRDRVLRDAGLIFLSVKELRARLEAGDAPAGWYVLRYESDDAASEGDDFLVVCESPKAEAAIDVLAHFTTFSYADKACVEAATRHPQGFTRLVAQVIDQDEWGGPWIPGLLALAQVARPEIQRDVDRALIQIVAGAMSFRSVSFVNWEILLSGQEVDLDYISIDRSLLLPNDASDLELFLHERARAATSSSADRWKRVAACDSITVHPEGFWSAIPWDRVLEPIRALRDDPEPAVRGAAHRAIAVGDGSDAPFSLLTPELLADFPEQEARIRGSTELVLGALGQRASTVPAGDRAAYATGLAHLLASLDHRPGSIDLPADRDVGNQPEIESALVQLLASERDVSRLWAVLLLARLDRTLPAGPALARLLGSGDFFTRSAAAGCLTGIDFADRSWLPGAVIDLIEAGHWADCGPLGSAIRRYGGPFAIADAEATIAAVLDERAGNRGALLFAEALLL